MNKIFLAFTLLSILVINQNYGAIGCQDNSWHMKKAYDHKTYHYVQCNCECHKWPQRPDGTCSKCGHRHDPGQGFVIVPDLSEKKLKEVNNKTVIRWRVVNKQGKKPKQGKSV